MGMGYCGAYADVIGDACIKVFCPDKYSKFQNSLEADGITLEEFAKGLNFDESVGSDETHMCYEELVNEFNTKTHNASLSLKYHNSEESGDRYDDVNGAYWECSNLYTLNDAGKALKGNFIRKFFVVLG